jgi:hypothetical protein
MILTTKLITRYVRWMERNNVKKFPAMPIIGKAYALVTHPDVIADLRQDTGFVAAVNYSSPNPAN